MGKITLVGTAHREDGLCNEGELLKILEAISPDVIFEEIRPSDFEARYRDTSKHTLEMRAVGRYLKTKPARQVPVDDYVVPDGFLRDMAQMEEYVQTCGAEYCELMDKMGEKKHLLGFRFLNSPEFEALNKRVNESYERAIAASGREDLKKTLSIYNEQMRRRDAAMVENIHDFCRNTPFREGVFLVGAGHMPAILEEIESRTRAPRFATLFLGPQG
jgi:hypothetical protein